MKTKKLTAWEKKALIIRYYNLGLTQIEIYKATKISKQLVRDWIEKINDNEYLRRGK